METHFVVDRTLTRCCLMKSLTRTANMLRGGSNAPGIASNAGQDSSTSASASRELVQQTGRWHPPWRGCAALIKQGGALGGPPRFRPASSTHVLAKLDQPGGVTIANEKSSAGRVDELGEPLRSDATDLPSGDPALRVEHDGDWQSR
jgi:hypothetical protein